MLNKVILFIFVIFSFSLGSQHLEIGKKWVDTLSSEYFFGRGYVYDGVNRAGDFISNEFSKLNLHPLPGQENYFQPFTHEVNSFPGKIEITVNGEKLINGVHYIVHPSSGPGQTKLKPIELNYPNLSDDDLNQAATSILEGDYNSVIINLNGAEPQEESQLTYKFLALANHVPLIFQSDKKLTWGVGTFQLKHPVFTVADSIELSNSKIEVHVEAEFNEAFESKNVAGYIPGKSKNPKTILFTAHYDHLGGMGSEVFIPGANDNASGTSMLAAIAKHYKKDMPENNIVFVAFAGEEAGILGSEYFVNSGVIGLDSIEMVLNIDLMGTGEDGITVVNGKVLDKQFNQLVKINEANNYLTKIKPRGPAKNSDHYYFTKNDVPAFFMYTLGDYPHYHDINDKYENLPFSKYNEVVDLLIQFADSF